MILSFIEKELSKHPQTLRKNPKGFLCGVVSPKNRIHIVSKVAEAPALRKPKKHQKNYFSSQGTLATHLQTETRSVVPGRPHLLDRF